MSHLHDTYGEGTCHVLLSLALAAQLHPSKKGVSHTGSSTVQLMSNTKCRDLGGSCCPKPHFTAYRRCTPETFLFWVLQVSTWSLLQCGSSLPDVPMLLPSLSEKKYSRRNLICLLVAKSELLILASPTCLPPPELYASFSEK